jgi:glycosyltransferase involved in cell wall biosynthesis
MRRKVLFILPYPLNRAPSQRFRVEAFGEILQKEGFTFSTDTFLDERAWRVLYQKGSLLQKGWAVVKGFFRRTSTVVFKAYKYEYIFIHREASPVGPPIYEWILAKLLRKKIIFDFDDAIWISTITESNGLAHSFKCFWKVACICKWSYKISAGNAFLADYAKQYNSCVAIIPTCVDTEARFNQSKDQSAVRPIIGWTGSHSTLKYLDVVVPVLKRLQAQYDFDFLVICNQSPDFDLNNLRFLPWKEATEIEDLLQINIGLMPLEQDEWSEGKCGFKIIQYLSLGIPAVASPVGVNKTIIEQGKNGFLCSTPNEWYAAIAALLEDEALRVRLGQEGRKKIERAYSIKANSINFISLFS